MEVAVAGAPRFSSAPQACQAIHANLIPQGVHSRASPPVLSPAGAPSIRQPPQTCSDPPDAEHIPMAKSPM